MGNQRRTILRSCSLREPGTRHQDSPEPSGEPKNNLFAPSEGPEPGVGTPRNRVGNQRITTFPFFSFQESEPRRQDPPEPSREPKNNHFPPSESPEPGARTPRNRMGSQRITIFIAPRARYSAPGPPGTERGKKILLENSFSEYACHRFSLLSLQGEFAYGILLWFSFDYLIEFWELSYDSLMGCPHGRLSQEAPDWPGCARMHQDAGKCERRPPNAPGWTTRRLFHYGLCYLAPGWPGCARMHQNARKCERRSQNAPGWSTGRPFQLGL